MHEQGLHPLRTPVPHLAAGYIPARFRTVTVSFQGVNQRGTIESSVYVDLGQSFFNFFCVKNGVSFECYVHENKTGNEAKN